MMQGWFRRRIWRVPRWLWLLAAIGLGMGVWWRYVVPQPAPLGSADPQPLAVVGTPVPLPSAPITPENAQQVVQLARLGDGHPVGVQPSPDGRWLAVRHDMGGVTVYDAQTFARGRSIDTRLHALDVATVASDGRTIATAWGKHIWLWRPDSSVLVLNGHEGRVTSMVFASDGELLASRSNGSTIRIWRVRDGAYLNSFSGFGELRAFQRTDAGTHTLVLTNEHAYSANGKHLLDLDGEDAALSPNGTTIASVSRDGSITLRGVDPTTPERTIGQATERTNQDQPAQIVFAPDGSLLAATQPDGLVRVWRAADGTLIQTLPVSRTQQLSFTPDSRSIITSPFSEGAARGALQQWRVADGGLAHEIVIQAQHIYGLRWSSDSTTLTTSPQFEGERTTNAGEQTWQLNAGTMHSPTDPKAQSSIEGLDGVNDATLVQNANGLHVWRSVDGAPIPEGDVILAGVLSPDQTLIATTTRDTIELWRSVDGAKLQTLTDPNIALVSDQTFSPDGHLIAASFSPVEDENQRYVGWWRVADGSLVHKVLIGDDKPIVQSLAFAPDSKTLVVEGKARVVIWNVEREAPVRVVCSNMIGSKAENKSSAKHVAFSPDGQTLAIGSDDGTMYLCSTGDGKLIRTLPNKTDQLNSIAFAPDGQTLATAQDHSVRLWRVADGTLLRELPTYYDVAWATFAPDSATLTAYTRYSTWWRWRIADGVQLDARALFAASDTGASVVYGGTVDRLPIWRRSDGNLARLLTGVSDVVNEVTQNSELVAALDGTDAIHVWRSADGTPVQTIRLAKHDRPIQQINLTPDGSMIVVVSSDGGNIYRVRDGALLHTLAVPKQQADPLNELWSDIRTATIAPDGHTLATLTKGGTLRLWNIADGALLTTVQSSQYLSGAFSFSPDGRLLAAGDYRGVVALWGVPASTAPRNNATMTR